MSFQSLDEQLNLLPLRLRPLDVHEPKQKRKPLRPPQRIPKVPRPRVPIKRRPELPVRLRGPHPVRGVPPPVGFRPVDLGQAALAHPALGRQPLGDLPVHLRPAAARPARREAPLLVLAVVATGRAVDPAEAEGRVPRLDVVDPRGCGFGLAQEEADAVVGWIVAEKVFPLFEGEGPHQGLVRRGDHAVSLEVLGRCESALPWLGWAAS